MSLVTGDRQVNTANSQGSLLRKLSDHHHENKRTPSRLLCGLMGKNFIQLSLQDALGLIKKTTSNPVTQHGKADKNM